MYSSSTFICLATVAPWVAALAAGRSSFVLAVAAALTGTRTKWPINDVFVPTMTVRVFDLYVRKGDPF